METKIAFCANILMYKQENKLLSNYSLKLIHYYKYIDDIFFIWAHGQNRFLQIIKKLTQHHQIHSRIPSLWYTSTYLEQSNRHTLTH